MADKTVVFQGAALRDVYAQVATKDGLGTTREKVGQEEFTYEATLDMDSIRRMGMRAAINVNGVAVRGPLRVRVVSRRKR